MASNYTSSESKKAVEKLESAMKKILKIVEELREEIQTTEKKTMERSITVPVIGTSQPVQATIATTKSDVTGMEGGESGSTCIAKIQRNLHLIRDDMHRLQELDAEIEENLSGINLLPLHRVIEQLRETETGTKETLKDLEKIRWKIISLVCQIPVLPTKPKKSKGLVSEDEDRDGDNHGKLSECSPPPSREANQYSEQEVNKAADELERTIEHIKTFEDRFQKETSSKVQEKYNDPLVIWLSIMSMFFKLHKSLLLLKNDLRRLQELNAEVAEELNMQCLPLDNLLNQARYGLTRANKKELEKINIKIFNLMCKVPLVPKRKQARFDYFRSENHGKLIECLPGIHSNEEDFKRLAVFKYVKTTFMELDDVKKKIYLLSFAVFPENQEVNQTMLMYWWIGEGILDYQVPPPKKGSVLDEKYRPENVVKEILKEFTEMNLIKPVISNRKVEPNSYKMTPFVHASVVQISKEMKLFDIYKKGEKPTMSISEMNKVCLVEGSSKNLAKAPKMTKADQIETVFNVSERFPDFTFKWFSEDQSSANKKFGSFSKNTYKGLKVFYLGRWERTTKRDIQIVNPELMKNLKHMTKLKLLSFQGISRIERLDDAVCKLRDLIILDLRACYNLEKLPDNIDSLKALTYLDITECFMMDRMPKKLSWLNNLEVLKGFVLSDATDEETVCTLADLKYLKKLRKLTVAINKEVSVEKLFIEVQDFKSLEKLKLAWGNINGNTEEKGTTEKKKKPIELPKNLKKLDLQCFPDVELPIWLRPDVLDKLEKLYIKGGTRLTGFGMSRPEEPTKCKVKILCLKFLPRLKVEWMGTTSTLFSKS